MAIALFVFLLSIKINGPIALLASIAVSFALTAFISPVVLSTLLKDYKPIQMFNFPKLFAVLIINAISLLSLWWVQLIIIVLVIVGLIILDKFSLSLEGLIKKIKEKMAKKQEEMDRELLREDVETMGKLTKAISGRS